MADNDVVCVVSPGTAALKQSLPLKAPEQQTWRQQLKNNREPSASHAAALLRAKGGARCDSDVALVVNPRETEDARRGDGAGCSAGELGEVYAFFVDALRKREKLKKKTNVKSLGGILGSMRRDLLYPLHAAGGTLPFVSRFPDTFQLSPPVTTAASPLRAFFSSRSASPSSACRRPHMSCWSWLASLCDAAAAARAASLIR